MQPGKSNKSGLGNDPAAPKYEPQELMSSLSFKFFDMSRGNLGPAKFFYPVEESLHSAAYIVKHETKTLKIWGSVLLDEPDRSGLRALDSKALAVPSRQKVCLDVGSNGGFFTLYSRALGCKTLAVDAQPWCLARLSSAVALNNFQDGVNIEWGAVSDDPNLTIEVGISKCSGLWSVHKEENAEVNKESEAVTKVKSRTCSELLTGWLGPDDDWKIDLFKIDTEGSEFSILKSCLPFLEARRIGHVLVEIAPARSTEITPLADIENVVNTLYDNNYVFARDYGSTVILSREKAIDLFIMTAASSEANKPINFHIHQEGWEFH
jgi:FkbM family methyltransferase